MRLTEVSQTNPAAVIAGALIVLLFGAVALAALPIQLLPNISQPRITVVSGWRAAAPAEMEQALTEPQEHQLEGISGVTEMRSFVQRGNSFINLTFALGTDMTQAMLDVINRINQVYPQPPADADRPQVFGGENNPFSQQATAATLLLRPLPGNPVTDLAVYQKMIEDVVKRRLAQVPGVSNVSLQSGRARQVQVNFDPYRAAALGVSVDQIGAALGRAQDASAGFSDVGRRQFTVRFTGREPVAELGGLILAWNKERPVYLRDLAEVKVGLADRQNYTFRNGKPAYYIQLTRANGSNTVAIIDGVRQAIAELNEGVLKSEGLFIEQSWDASIYIRRAIGFVRESLLVGILLAVGGLWYFLRGPRALAVIAFTIPLSLAVAVVALHILGRTLNVISLAGLAFSTGIVTDAALIVQGNIIRYFQSGRSGRQATAEGAAEVMPALFASMLTSVAIFLPVLFMRGVEGQLFADLAITMAVAHAASLLVAMTVIPAANRWALARAIPADQHRHWWKRMAEWAMAASDSPWLRKLWITGLIAGSLCFCMLLAPKVDYLPVAPADNLFGTLVPTAGTSLGNMRDEMASTIIKRLEPYMSGAKKPQVKYYNLFFDNSGNTGLPLYPLNPGDGARMQKILRDEILAGLPDTEVYVGRNSLLSLDGGSTRGIQVDLQGADMPGLLAAGKVAQDAINQAIPGSFPQPTPPLSLAEPELQLQPEEWRISHAGMDRGNVASAMRALTGGLYIGDYFDGNERLQMILRGPHWSTPEQLAELPLLTPLAGVQTVGDLAGLKQTVGPTTLLRLNGRRTVDLFFEPPENMTIAEAMTVLHDKVEPQVRAALPVGATLSYNGSASDLSKALKTMAQNFAMALVILFALMAALFKSVRDSLIVMLAIPVAMAGGIAGLRLGGLFHFQALDLLTMIGFIILLGLVVNASILLVDQTRARERAGVPRREAVAQALETRARPIVLSTLTAVLGMLPLMLAPGLGSEIYRGLATVTVGGMVLGTAFTWFLMPSLLRLGETQPSIAAHEVPA
ncbi:MAG TPA: efflux RND transporter permease subunit [Nevskia sp.]|nr:efflux RND transporter permease subunit [Nevskia sp.]